MAGENRQYLSEVAWEHVRAMCPPAGVCACGACSGKAETCKFSGKWMNEWWGRMLLAKRTVWTGPEDWNIFQELQII